MWTKVDVCDAHSWNGSFVARSSHISSIQASELSWTEPVLSFLPSFHYHHLVLSHLWSVRPWKILHLRLHDFSLWLRLALGVIFLFVFYIFWVPPSGQTELQLPPVSWRTSRWWWVALKVEVGHERRTPSWYKMQSQKVVHVIFPQPRSVSLELNFVSKRQTINWN